MAAARDRENRSSRRAPARNGRGSRRATASDERGSRRMAGYQAQNANTPPWPIIGAAGGGVLLIVIILIALSGGGGTGPAVSPQVNTPDVPPTTQRQPTVPEDNWLMPGHDPIDPRHNANNPLATRNQRIRDTMANRANQDPDSDYLDPEGGG